MEMLNCEDTSTSPRHPPVTSPLSENRPLLPSLYSPSPFLGIIPWEDPSLPQFLSEHHLLLPELDKLLLQPYSGSYPSG